MAAAVPLEDVEEALATCDICGEPFDADSRVPLTLIPCRHVFCRACVITLAKVGAFPCPNCRAHVDLGQKGVDGLSKDRVTMNAVDYIAMKKKTQTSGINCTDCPDRAKAVFRCHTCRTHLCTKCHDAHTRTAATRNHQMVDLHVFTESLENFVKEKESCPKHPDKDIEIYCKTCLVSVCTLCGMVEHQSHDVCYFKSAHQLTVDQIKSLKTQLSLRKNHMADLREEQLKLIQTYRAITDKVKQDIQTQFTIMKKALEERQTELMQACDAILKSEERSVQQFLEMLRKREVMLQERMTSLERIERVSRPVQLVSVQHTVSLPSAKLLCCKNPLLYVPQDIFFDPVGCQTISTTIKTTGNIARPGQPRVCRPFRVDLEQLLRLQCDRVTRFDLEGGSTAFVCVQNQDRTIFIGKPNAGTGRNDISMIPCTMMEFSAERLNTRECHMSDSTTLVNQPSHGSPYAWQNRVVKHNAYPGTTGTIVSQPDRGLYFECQVSAEPVRESCDLVFAEVALSAVGNQTKHGVCRHNGWGMEFAMSQNAGGRMMVIGMSQNTFIQGSLISDVPMRAGVVTNAKVGLLLKNHILTVFDTARHRLLFQMGVDDTDMEPWFGFFSCRQFHSMLRVVSGKDVALDAKKLQMLSSAI